MNIKNILILILLLSPSNFFAQVVSQKLPNLNAVSGNMLEQLNGTVWVTTDFQKNEDLYAFFVDSKYGGSSVSRGGEAVFPQRMYPIKYMQKGTLPHSGIFMVSSQDKMLYYAFAFLTPLYLVISAGHDDIAPLLVDDVSWYLVNGYVLKLVY